MKGSSDKAEASSEVLATNRKAFHEYHILDRWEAGVELRGGEVKSARAREISINESFASFDQGQLFLHAFHINPYACAVHTAHDPIRPKRLLMHRREIDRLAGLVAVKGHTLIPLRLYVKRGLIKVELALCKGKLAGDKRDTLRRKTADREAQRDIAARMKR
ncbi:MAG: SsrA-binding protein SmpB [Lentisphaerota bacterium]